MFAASSFTIGGGVSAVSQGLTIGWNNINWGLVASGVISGALMPSNFDGYKMSGIYNTSKGYLTSRTLKSAKK